MTTGIPPPERTLAGRYGVLRVLAPGPTEVLLAHDTRLDRRVVVKHATGAEASAGLRHEASATSRVAHPNVVALYDWWQVGDESYAVLPHHDGEPLSDRIARQGAQSIAEALNIARQLLAALAACHEAGVVHRDVKPSNVLIRRDGLVVLLDFGIASVRGETPAVPMGHTVGTPSYVSPEQARGLAVSDASDLYSLGTVLYEMLTGSRPFVGRDSAETAQLHVTTRPSPPSSLRPGLPSALDALVMRALSKRPTDRWASARAMLADVDRCVRDCDQLTTTIPIARPRVGARDPFDGRVRSAVAGVPRVGIAAATIAMLLWAGVALRPVAIAGDASVARLAATSTPATTPTSTPGLFERIIDGRVSATATPAPALTRTPADGPLATATPTGEARATSTPTPRATSTPAVPRTVETPVAGSITTTIPPLGASRHLINASLRSGEAVRARVSITGGKRDITLRVLSGDGATVFGPNVVVGDETYVWPVERRAPWTIVLENDGSLLSGKTVTLTYDVIRAGQH